MKRLLLAASCVVAVLSRAAFSAPMAGDVDLSGAVNAIDVQLTINSALGIAVSHSTDLDCDGGTHATDVQLVINAALGTLIDADGDGLCDVAEANLGTNPNRADSDRDDLSDYVEVNTYYTNPSNPDTDSDGVSDGQEVLHGEDPLVAAEYVIITEFVASNDRGLEDEDGDRPDWIELYNLASFPVNLAGWSLTDDPDEPDKWLFPEVTIGGGEYLVVFASGKDRSPTNGDNLHTSFKLSAPGEYLAFYSASGVLQPSSVLDPFPAQSADVAYGRHVAEPGFCFFEPPTPGAPNDDSISYEGIVGDTKFSHDRGFYYEGFDITITVDTPGAAIHYTTDGSTPSETHGEVYAGAIHISATTCLRAMAFADGWKPSDVDTHTYIFLDDVLYQTRPEGYPADWSEGTYGDYDMDPDLVNDPQYSGTLEDDLQAIPTLSIVTDRDNLFDPSTGIYMNPTEQGMEWERAASAEFIYPAGCRTASCQGRSDNAGFQVNCGIRIQGGISRYPGRTPKHQFRLAFRGIYGRTRLDCPLFGDDATDSINTLVCRAGYSDGWLNHNVLMSARAQYVRDEWARDIQLEVTGLSSHGMFVHLYLNGLYWGLYNVVERPDGSFASSYLGGEQEDYDSLNAGEPTDGDRAAWDAMMAIADAGMEFNEQYYAVQDYVDVPNLIDYMILCFYQGNGDWPRRNWYAIRKREPGAGYKFVSWDAEAIFGIDVEANLTQVGELDLDADSPAGLYYRLRDNAEFRLLFADHVHRHFFNGGVLTPERVAERWMRLSEEVDEAINGESARWGDWRRDDAPSPNPTADLYLRDPHWLAEQNRLLTEYFPYRADIVLGQFRDIGLYPNADAPVFHINGSYQHGGRISTGDDLSMSAATGTVYYTLDGSDPRLPGSSQVTSTILVGEQDPKRALVPGNVHDLADSTAGIFEVTCYTAHITVNSLNDAASVIFFPLLQQSATSETAGVINYLNTGENGHYSGDNPFPGTTLGTDADDFIVSATGKVLIPEAGPWTFGVSSDDGFYLEVAGFVSSYESTRLPADTLSVFDVAEPGVYDLTLVSFERDAGSELELFAAQGSFSTFNPVDFRLVGDTAHGGLEVVDVWTSLAFDDSTWLSGTGGVGYDASSYYDDLIGLDVETQMYNQNTTCCVRIPFTVGADDLEQFTFMTLKMRYDDGFAAYLNGEKVAEANAPTKPQWNSEATDVHDDPDAFFQNFSISENLSALRPGENVLAIHGLNFGVSSSSFLISAELVAGENVTGSGGASPTANEYDQPIRLTETSHVKARLLDNNEWSALNEATFTFASVVDDLRITEIMYHPQDPPGGDPDAEFIELKNVGVEPLDLSSVAFTVGIEFMFPNVELAPGEYVVVVKDHAAFASQYANLPGGVQRLGPYSGRLDNAGEEIELEDAAGQTILAFEYDDAWYPSTDGDGFSLTIIDPANSDPESWGQRNSWRPSSSVGGSPGEGDQG